MAARLLTSVSSGQIAVLDASVRIPAAPRDTLLRAAEIGLYRPHWTDHILSEVERNLVELGLAGAQAAHHLIATINRFFPEARVSGYEPLIEHMENHPKDRHVLAAAVQARASLIVTEDRRGFPASVLHRWAIDALTIDAFLSELFAVSPSRMAQLIVEQAADLVEPSMSANDVLDELAVVAPTFVAEIAKHLRH